MPASLPTTPRPALRSAGSGLAARGPASTGAPTSVRPIEAVERTLAVLDCLAAEATDLGTNEIARRVGSNASSVSRLLSTLVQADYVRRVPATGRYRLGLRLVELGHCALARVDLREVARPYLHALTAASGETATLSVPAEGSPMTVDFVQSPASVRSVAQLGRPAVPHATATGKVFLAYRQVGRERAGSPAGGPAEGRLTRFTDRTITDPGQLAADLAGVREHGFAQAVGEREEELNAIAVPVLAAGAELVAMLGVQGPAGRFDPPAMRAVLEPLREHARRLAGHLAAPHG